MKQNAVCYNQRCQRQKELEEKFEVPLSCSASSKVKNLGSKEFHDYEPFTTIIRLLPEFCTQT